MQVAFLGLGIMGAAMAANLVQKGHRVTTWNRTPGKSVAGANAAHSPRAAAAQAEVVWVCVSDTAAVKQVLFGPGGVAESLRPGAIVVDSSTISPAESRNFAELIRAQGADFVDAPVTGSKIGAKDGTLIFIAGGRKESIGKLHPLFSAMGKQVIHVGDNGQGEAAKLAMNLMIVLIYEGFIEALTLAKNLGVEQRALFSLIQASMVRSGVVDYKMPFVEKRDFSPNFPLRLMHKDIRLMLDDGRSTNTALPGLEKIKEIYDEAAALGLSDLDYAATLQVLDRKA